ncbi:VWA domain-containing protein [candidate division WOR-3 bacterium]|nr:VWA domain-containing protein [candidate division WOR-3 bacterium]
MIEGLDNLISNERSTGYKGLLMNKLVKIWSGENYYIEDVGSEASVDLQHKKMHLPLNSKDWQTLRAYGQHESAHVLFTNTNSYEKLMKGLCEKYDKDKVWKIINAFEDRRVEYLFSKIYAGAESEFRDSNTEALKELLGKLHTFKPLDRIIVQIGAYMINGIRPENKELQVLAEEVKEEIESKWIQTSVVNVSEKVLDYLDKYLAKRKKEREDAKAKERIRTRGEKDDESSEGTSDEGDKSEGDSESDESFDIDKFLEDNKETEESKKDTEKTKDGSEPEEGESEHKEDDEEDLKTEEDITGKKEKIEESRFKSKTKNKKSIEKAIEKRKSAIIDDGDIEKKDPFKKLTKDNSYIPVRKLITEEELEKDFTELHKQYYEDIKNKNIGLIRRLRTNLMEIKNAVEIQESKGGLININRSINMVAQSGRPAFNRAVENTNRNVSITLLLDQSGSMAGSKILEAKDALIILSEVLNGLQGFEFAMFGFCSADSSGYGKNYHTMKTFQYKGFSNRRTDLIVSADIDNGNRDGYHIRVIRDYIQQHANVNAAKFLVVLSDGVPEDNHTEYMFQIALNDTMKAVQEVEYQFPVVGVLFGDPKPGQQHLYKNRVHCASGKLSEGLEELVLNIQQQIMRG